MAYLTTIDNPYNPNTQFDAWYAFDEQMGYHSCSYLARIARTVQDLSDADYARAVDDAIDEICRYNINGKYKKVMA